MISQMAPLFLSRELWIQSLEEVSLHLVFNDFKQRY